MPPIRPPAPGLLTGLTWLLVAAVLAYAGWESVSRARHLLELSRSEGEAGRPAAVESSSPTGYTEGRRGLVLPRGSTDAAHWIMQTQMMRPEGTWRIRSVPYDNAPAGRAVHWASPYRWWLAVLAWIDHVATGRPWGIAVERASLSAGPVMLAAALLAVAWLLTRRFTRGAAVVAVVGAVAVAPFYVDFLPGRADHHGLANLCTLGTVLFFVIGAGSGLGSEPRRPAPHWSARSWLDLSAVSGGIGLWISAATQVPVLIGLGLGVLASVLVGRKAQDWPGALLEPSQLRRWGLIGAGVSLTAYLVEYAPHLAQLRLEVNHPLYALAWAGAGELLGVATVVVSGSRIHGRRVDARRAGLALVAVAALPLTLVLIPRTFTVAHPLLWQIHSLHLAEFQSLYRHLHTPDFNWRRLELLLPMLLLAPILLQLSRRPRATRVKAWLALAVSPPLLGWALGLNQVRWASLAFVLTIPALAAFLSTRARGRQRAMWTAACLVILAPPFLMTLVRARASAETTVEEIQNLVERDLAHWLKQRNPDRTVVVAAAPGVTTKLIFLGGLTGVGTFYWENAPGLEKLAAFYGAASAVAAHDVARAVNLTHIVFVSWSPTELELAKLHRGIADPSAATPEDAFIARLLSGAVPPPWLRAVAFPLPDHPALQGAHVRIWEVTPPMELPDAVVRATAFQLDLKAIDRAQQLVPLLERFPDYLPAAVMRAAVAARLRDETAFGAAMRQVRERISEAGNLGLEDHLHLVVVLTVAQQLEAAQQQLRAAMQKVTAPALRQLPAGTLTDLMALTSALNVSWSDPHLQRVAEDLLPPARL